MLKAVAEIGFTIEKIFITHGHADHAGGRPAELKGRTGVPIEGPHPDDSSGSTRSKPRPPNSALLGARSFTPDRWLKDGDTGKIRRDLFDVRHCPGRHAPGHVMFHLPPSELCLRRRVLFQGSIGRTDFPRGNHQDLLNSIRDRLWPMGDDTTFVPGHGPLSTFGQERQTNPFVSDSALSAS